MKKFNLTGVCNPRKHYMVDTTTKLDAIAALVDEGKYFTINRARQYGKTTTLHQLEQRFKKSQYITLRLSFEGAGITMFETPGAFCQEFLSQIAHVLGPVDAAYANRWLDTSIVDFGPLGRHIDTLCKDKQIVLIIDEVDQASNNQIFLQFLGMLRRKYLDRDTEYTHTFHSVILAGVYDIKNIQLKSPSQPPTFYNSPWNIATDFDIDMTFSPAEIATMLADYQDSTGLAFDTQSLSAEIYKYTSGYPFLVSRICSHVDTKLDKDWTISGIRAAVRLILSEKNVLFDDIIKNLENNPNVYDFIYSLIFNGTKSTFVRDDPAVEHCHMFGLITINHHGLVQLANKVFETRISNYFISKNQNTTKVDNLINIGVQEAVVTAGRFDMAVALGKFAQFYTSVFTTMDTPFLESHGRLIFLSYLFPLLNGKGFYHIESQLTDRRRMDVVVDYGQDQFIIELKLWKGEVAHAQAYAQLLGYMDTKNATEGYLLTFDFRGSENKMPKAEWVCIDGRNIFDVIV